MPPMISTLQKLVSYLQRLQPNVPEEKPFDTHVSPANSEPSHSSPSSKIPLPHNSGLTCADAASSAGSAGCVAFVVLFLDAPPPPPPPPPPLPLPPLDEPETVVLPVARAVPPVVPATVSVRAQVPEVEEAVTVHDWDDVDFPESVPIVFDALDTLHGPLADKVAVTPVADSVPRFCMVAEGVNAALAETDDDVVNVGTLSSAADVTDTEPQSAVHVLPIATQTDWAPSVDGVTEKSRVFAWPD